MSDPKTIIAELWRRGSLTFKLHEGQAKVHTIFRALPGKIREALLFISRRWGKSYLGVVLALEDCLQGDNRQVFIIGPDIKQTKRIITPLINKITADAPPGLILQSKSELMWKVGKSHLILGGFDSALESLRGMDAFSIYLEESGQANAEEYEYTLQGVLRPMTQDSKGRMTHLTTPAKDVNHPLHTITLPKTDLSGALFRFTIEDNPRLTPEEIADEIKEMGGLDNVHCQRELFCKIVKDAQRLVVPEFDETQHVTEFVKPEYCNELVTIDFGGSRDNHASLLSFYDFERAKICILDEAWLPINTPTSEIATKTLLLEAKHNYRQERRIIDAAAQTLIDLRNLGLRCMPPLKGRDSVESSIQAIRVAFQRGLIEIHPRCINLIAALKYGRWNKNRLDFERTKELGHNDMLASLSYNYRHINRTGNPFPRGLGTHPERHYVENLPEDDTEATAIDNAYYGDE